MYVCAMASSVGVWGGWLYLGRRLLLGQTFDSDADIPSHFVV